MALPTTSALPQANEKRRFVIRSCLGRGGFGEVYRASMTNANGLETDVAVKVLHPDLDADAQSVERLRDEGRMLGALVHPAIVRVYDLVILEDRIGLVTEYVEGEDLSTCMKASDPMGARAVVEVIGRVADALRAAWQTPAPGSVEPLHLIHRDIKPANIRIGTQGAVKLLDFGVARSSGLARETHTSTGHMVGSYLYMAPECLLENTFGQASDVFALGVTLYECLAQRRLFAGMSLRELYVLVLKEEAYREHIDAHLAPLDAPEPVRRLLGSMLRRDASARPSAATISSLCDDLVEQLPGNTLRRWCRQHDWTEPSLFEGLLDGRTITEATMVTQVRGDFVRPEGARPRRRLGLGLLFGTLGTVGLAVGLLVGGLGLGLAGWVVWTGGGARQVVLEPTRATEIPTLAVGAMRSVERAETTRSATPTSTLPALTSVRFTTRPSTIPARLLGGGRTFGNFSRVSAGTYKIQVNWRGEGFETLANPVHVNGAQVHITCNSFKRTCDVE